MNVPFAISFLGYEKIGENRDNDDDDDDTTVMLMSRR